MATREFIEKRIDGAKKNLEKLEKKLVRIEKAKESNWENNPYYYTEDDLKYTLRDIDSAKNSLNKYEQDLVELSNKEASRNVPAITEFLDKWEVRMNEYYQNEYEKYLNDKDDENNPRNKAYADYRYFYENAYHLYPEMSYKEMNQKTKELYKVYEKLSKEFRSRYAHIIEVLGKVDKSHSFTSVAAKIINNEKNAKYDDLIERICAVVGEISDATHLHIGEKGDINGIIIGNKGKASIETIGAGGYNIQCFHFRTLIHKIS